MKIASKIKPINGADFKIADAKDIAIGDSDVEAKIEKVYEDINFLKTYITPQMFGAVGDGKNDDTIALQNAINFCVTNNAEFRGKSGSTYGVTKSIEITKPILMQGNNCNIKALEMFDDYIFKFSNNGENYSNTVRGFNFWCEEKCNGIRFENIKVVYFQECNIYDPSKVGIEFDSGFGLRVNNIKFRNNRGRTNTTALICNSDDSSFYGMEITDFETGIDMAGVGNYIAQTCCWCTFKEIIPTAKFINVRGNIRALNCVCDTIPVFVNNNDGNHVIELINCRMLFNMNYYKAEVLGDTKTKVLNLGSVSYSSKIIVENLLVNKPNSLDVFFSDYKNLSTSFDFYCHNPNARMCQNIPKGRVTELTPTNDWEFEEQVFLQKDNTNYLYIVAKYKGTDFSTITNHTVTFLPSYGCPDYNIQFTAFQFKDRWYSPTASCYAYLNTGGELSCKFGSSASTDKTFIFRINF